MTDSSAPTHRSLIDPPADRVTLRDAEEVEGDDDMMEVRMPIASTGEVRNEGDDPLSADELRGMARQINQREVGVFPEHGAGDFVSYGKYSQFEKLGYWDDAAVEAEAAADESDLLMATARMPDPETLPAATGDYRAALGIVKEQAKRGIPISASIGWREDENAPGGNDLMEASIVGIGADPRTSTEGGTEALARAAVDAGADPGTLVAEVARAVAPDDQRPFGPPGDPNRWDSWDECMADAQEMDDVDSPEEYCGWAKAQTEGEHGATDTDTDHDMSETDDPGDEQDAGTTEEEQTADDGETTERTDMTEEEYRAFMRDQQEQQTEILRTLAESLREDDEDDDDEEDDEDDEDEEQSADTDEEQSASESTSESDEDRDAPDDSDLSDRVAELEAALEAVRSGETDVETPGDDADDEGEEDRDADEAETTDAPSPAAGLGDYR